MRPRSRALSVLLSLSVSAWLPAQQPAPGGETRARDMHAPWHAEEAMLWQWLEDAAAARRQSPDVRLRMAFQGPPSGYLLRAFAAEGGGFATVRDPLGAPEWVLYLVPEGSEAGVDLAFCLASDGRLLVSDNRGRYSRGTPPDADAATGSGSRGRFVDILASPGNGRDGLFWQTRETLRPRRLQVTLRDEHGQPVTGGRVVLAPQRWLGRAFQVTTVGDVVPQERPLPAGSVDVDAAGAGTLQGIAAAGLIVCAGDASGLMALPPEAIALEDSAMRLTLPLEALRNARANANESAAIATLKNISSAQSQCQASTVIDTNGNGAGEYGFFGELSGSLPVRSDGAGGVGTAKIEPPVLSRAFANVKESRVVRSGYVFQIFLPDANHEPVEEAAAGGGAGCKVDSRRAEVMWCCYAWPVTAGTSGRRAFFVNQAGDVLAAGNADGRYSGSEKPVDPKAAFTGEGRLDHPCAANRKGIDGQRWIVVQ